MKNKGNKPVTGKLIHVLENGRAIILAEGLKFWELQNLKKIYVLRGLKKENLKLTY
jgi:hypothetical protein